MKNLTLFEKETQNLELQNLVYYVTYVTDQIEGLFKPLTNKSLKMARHILCIFQHLVQDFYSISDHFGTLYMNALRCILYVHFASVMILTNAEKNKICRCRINNEKLNLLRQS